MAQAFGALRQILEFTPYGLFHTDQGYRYTNATFAEELKKMGLTQNLSRRVNCFYNAVIESFNGTITRTTRKDAGTCPTRKFANK